MLYGGYFGIREAAMYLYPVFYHETTIWVNYNDLTVLPNPGTMVNKGTHPQMALIHLDSGL